MEGAALYFRVDGPTTGTERLQKAEGGIRTLASHPTVRQDDRVITLALNDIEPDLFEELARRARQLGTTVEREAVRALREHLAEPAHSPDWTKPGTAPASSGFSAPTSVAPAKETLQEAPRHARLTGRDLVRLLQAVPRPDDAYLDAVEDAARSQPMVPETPWER